MSADRLELLYVSREDVPADHGGAVHTWQVASLLARRGHRVTLLSERRPGALREETLDGVRIVRTRMSLRGRSIPLLGLPALRRCDAGFDVAMERFDTFGGLAAIHSRRRGTPLVLEVNYPHLDEILWKWGRRGGLYAAARPLLRLLSSWNRWQFERAAALVAPRRSIVPEAQRHKVELVHWGANIEQFAPPVPSRETAELRASLGLAGRRVVVSHGSFQPWHAPALYPEIVARVAAQAPDVVFLLLGGGKGVEGIERTLRERGLARFCLLPGRVGFARIPLHLGLADVALAPFDTESYAPLRHFGFFWSPAKIFEYMACALPVVTTDQDYLLRVVEAEGAGVCLPENDAAAIASAIFALLGDEEGRRRLGRAGRAAATSKYSWQAHVQQLEGLLQRVVRERNAAGAAGDVARGEDAGGGQRKGSA